MTKSKEKSLFSGAAMSAAATIAAAAIDRKGDQMKDAQALVIESCRDYVRAKPMAAIGMAVAAGYLVSWLLRVRKLHERKLNERKLSERKPRGRKPRGAATQGRG